MSELIIVVTASVAVLGLGGWLGAAAVHDFLSGASGSEPARVVRIQPSRVAIPAEPVDDGVIADLHEEPHIDVS